MSSTATNLRALLPECEVLSPDLPIAPDKAYDMLCRLCNEEQPRLLIGTSMGGMFAQQVRGYRKILVNPAFHVSAFMRTQLGIREFLNPDKTVPPTMKSLRICATPTNGWRKTDSPAFRTSTGKTRMPCSAQMTLWSKASKNTRNTTNTPLGLKANTG